MRLLVVFLVTASSLAVALAQSQLTKSEESLVQGSKQAILATGISESYFDAHFKLLKVVDKPSDRRVMWQFSVNQHQAIVTDAIGFYSEGKKQIDTHSVAKSLGQTSEINRTVTRARALRLMKSCIGPFEEPSVTYGPVDGRAELLLVAAARTRHDKEISEKEKQREREESEKRDERRADAAGTDVLENEEEEGRRRAPIVLGAVNLRTGKCTKGAALSSPFAQ